MDKLTAMATFVKVVDAGSFTRAADALGLPKARVSQRVSDLEKHLGVRLLNRTTRALSLTHDGSAYFDKCQVLLQQIDELEATLRGGTATPIGRLRVDSLITIARWVIAPRLPYTTLFRSGSAICWRTASIARSGEVRSRTPA